jgi:putative SOS response-associated peptidase YedK
VNLQQLSVNGNERDVIKTCPDGINDGEGIQGRMGIETNNGDKSEVYDLKDDGSDDLLDDFFEMEHHFDEKDAERGDLSQKAQHFDSFFKEYNPLSINPGYNLAPSSVVNIIRHKSTPFLIPSQPFEDLNDPDETNSETISTSPTKSSNSLSRLGHFPDEFNPNYVMDSAIWGLNATKPLNFNPLQSIQHSNLGPIATKTSLCDPVNHNDQHNTANTKSNPKQDGSRPKFPPLHNIRSDNPRLLSSDHLIPCVVVIDAFVEWKDPWLSGNDPNEAFFGQNYLTNHLLENNPDYLQLLHKSTHRIKPSHVPPLTAHFYNELSGDSLDDGQIEKLGTQTPETISTAQFTPADKKSLLDILLDNFTPVKARDSALVVGKRTKQPYLIHSGVRLCQRCGFRCELAHVPKANQWEYCECVDRDNDNVDRGDGVNSAVDVSNQLRIESPNKSLLQYDALYCAGVYTVHKDQNDNDVITCGVVTLESNQQMGWLHDRMPFILSPFQIEEWLWGGECEVRTGEGLEDILKAKIETRNLIENKIFFSRFQPATLKPLESTPPPTPLQLHKTKFLSKYISPFISLEHQLPTENKIPPEKVHNFLKIFHSISPLYSLIKWYPITPLISKIGKDGKLINDERVLGDMKGYLEEERGRNLGRFFGLKQNDQQDNDVLFVKNDDDDDDDGGDDDDDGDDVVVASEAKILTKPKNQLLSFCIKGNGVDLSTQSDCDVVSVYNPPNNTVHKNLQTKSTFLVEKKLSILEVQKSDNTDNDLTVISTPTKRIRPVDKFNCTIQPDDDGCIVTGVVFTPKKAKANSVEKRDTQNLVLLTPNTPNTPNTTAKSNDNNSGDKNNILSFFNPKPKTPLRIDLSRNPKENSNQCIEIDL